MNRIPVLLLTGFLGSGKTTLLNRLLANEDFRDTAVIINEAGAVGIDHLLVERSSDDILLLEGGCMCCALRGSLGATMSALLRRRQEGTETPFRRVVIETSGLADPGPILQAMVADPAFSRACQPAGVVAVVDAVAALATLDNHAEALAQVGLADTLLVTKTDLASPAQWTALDRRLSDLNPEATRAEAAFGAIDPARLWVDDLGLSPAWLSRPATRFSSGPACEIATASRMFEGILAPDDLDAWLERTTQLFGPSLLRLKGVLNIAGQPLPVVIHGVQAMVYSPGNLKQWPAGPRANRLVLIGRDVEPQLLDDALARLVEAARPESTAEGPRRISA